MLLGEFIGVFIAFIKLRLGVFQNDFSLDNVLDDFIATDFDFGSHPLIAMIRF